jgi:flagellar biosynthesis/type III secretory pathway protein FliH
VEPDARISRNAAPLAPRRIPAAVHEADGRVREMVRAAEERAREIVAEAEAARARVLAEASEAGRREGLGRAAAVLALAAAARDRRLADLEGEVAALALEVARKVLGRELAEREGAVADLAARAIAEARDRRHVTLRVNPRDAAAVRAAEGRLAAILAVAPLAVREDAAVPPGGAIVETEAGRIDARVEVQLAQLARAVEEELP